MCRDLKGYAGFSYVLDVRLCYFGLQKDLSEAKVSALREAVCEMGSAPSHGLPKNPTTEVYQASRDGRTTDLVNVLKQLDGRKRKKTLETKINDGDDFTTPLIIAARNGNLDAVKILLKYNADIDARAGTVKLQDKINVAGCTPLFAAAASGHLDVAKLLLKQNAKVDDRTFTNSTPLRAAAYFGRLEIARLLVENGADVNASKEDNTTPLSVACFYGHTSVVKFLIEHGANMNVQDNDGNTPLHDSMRKGRIEIADKLLSHGALQLQNKYRLTPLLTASNCCEIKMVEHFIKHPKCTKEQRIDALELLGATIANDPDAYDIDAAFWYIKRGMEERFQDKSHPLLKRHREPNEAYQNRKESQTLEELALLEGDDNAIHMEGLIIRERILGNDNTEVCSPLNYRGAVLADSGNFDHCISLWHHALKIRTRCNKLVATYLEDFAGLFADMISRRLVLKINLLQEFFEQLVSEYEKLTEKLQNRNLQVGYEEVKAIEEELERLTDCALYLLMIYPKVIHTVEDEKLSRLLLVQRFIRLDPRTRDGDTLLHLAACYSTAIKDFHVRSVCKLPCVKTMTVLLLGGVDVNAVNPKGDTPLHVAVTFKPSPKEADTLKAMLELLLDYGAVPKLKNIYGLTAMDYCATDESRRTLSEKSGMDIMTTESRATDSLRSFPQDPVGQSATINQSSSIVKLAVLGKDWCFPFTAFSYLTKEFAVQLAKHHGLDVIFLVPDKSLSDEDKKEADSRGITIAEAKAHPGFPDPVDWLCFPPNDFFVDVVVALDDNLGKIAYVLREHLRSRKRIQMVYSLNTETGTFSFRFHSLSKESGKLSSNRRKHQTNIGMCERADLVVGLGPKIADELTASLRYLNKQVVNLTPGIFSELSDLTHAKEDGRNFRILVLSGNESAEFFHDRCHIAAKAISLLRDNTFYLVFTGVQKDKRSDFLKTCSECDVAEQQLIIRSFPVSEEDLKRLFCEVDLAILLSAQDECGLIALCALSAGLPLYACGDSAFAASLKEVPLGTASIIDSEDAKMWADSIRKARETDREIRLEQAMVLRSQFEETYNWDKQVDSLVKKISDMLQGD